MNFKHGMRRSRIYQTWIAMRGRCSNPNDAAFCNYGARGITVSADWESFEKFYADMGEPPAGMSLERIDNNKGYSKENCTWADRKSQNRNKRSNVLIEFNGEKRPLGEWAEIIGLRYNTLWNRIFVQKIPVREAFNPDLIPQKQRKISAQNMRCKNAKYAVLKESDVRQIRFLHEQGVRNLDIAREYKINASHVSRIISRHAWGWLS